MERQWEGRVDLLTSWPVGQREAGLADRLASWSGGKEKSTEYGVLRTDRV